jgi:hypothetical protein
MVAKVICFIPSSCFRPFWSSPSGHFDSLPACLEESSFQAILCARVWANCEDERMGFSDLHQVSSHSDNSLVFEGRGCSVLPYLLTHQKPCQPKSSSNHWAFYLGKSRVNNFQVNLPWSELEPRPTKRFPRPNCTVTLKKVALMFDFGVRR